MTTMTLSTQLVNGILPSTLEDTIEINQSEKIFDTLSLMESHNMFFNEYLSKTGKTIIVCWLIFL